MCTTRKYSGENTFFVVFNVLEISKQTRRTKSRQILSYADDVVIMSRSENVLKDTSLNIGKRARRSGRLVNENKTKYMQVARAVLNDVNLCCGKHKFEHIKEFSYLGSQMNQTNSISSEIQARILSGNRCYYEYGKLMKSRALNRSSKYIKV